MLSIVTVNLNNAKGLERTLQSVGQQVTAGKFEHVIIDGNSTDESILYIQNYSSENTNVIWLSEPDNGIYDAMNKGLKLATGEYIAFLNSGDIFANSCCLDHIIKEKETDPNIDVIFGDLCFLDKDSNVIRRWRSGAFNKAKLYYGWMPPHPMTTIRHEIIKKNLGFDIRYKIAADYDLMLRIFLGEKLSIKYTNLVLVYMEKGGLSNSSIFQVIRANVEVMKSWFRIKGVRTPFWIFFTKPLGKLAQIKKISGI